MFARKQELAAPGLETKRNGQVVGMTSSREWLGSGAARIAAGILLIRGHRVDSGASGTGASVAGLSMVLAAHLIAALNLVGRFTNRPTVEGCGDLPTGPHLGVLSPLKLWNEILLEV